MSKRVLLSGLIILSLLLFAEEGIRILEYKNKKITVEAEGKLVWVKMTNFPTVPWKELCLMDKTGKREIIAVLIGSKVESLLKDKEGRFVKVRGLLKPEIWVWGRKTPVIEVDDFFLLK